MDLSIKEIENEIEAIEQVIKVHEESLKHHKQGFKVMTFNKELFEKELAKRQS